MIVGALAAAQASGGFNWKTLLMFVGGAVLLAFFSSIGIIARIRERRIQDRKQEQRSSQQRANHQPGNAGDQPSG